MWVLLVLAIYQGQIQPESLQVYPGFKSPQECFETAEKANELVNKNYDPEHPIQVLYACGLLPERVVARN